MTVEEIDTKTVSFTPPPPENKVQNEPKEQGIGRTKRRIGMMKPLCRCPSSWSAREGARPNPLVWEVLWESAVRETCLGGCVSVVTFAQNFLSAALFVIQFILHIAPPFKGYDSVLSNVFTEFCNHHNKLM